MKAYRIILYTLLVMIPAFFSCSDETDDQNETPSGEGNEVSFTLDREGIRLKVAGDSFEAGDAVGVYAVEGGNPLIASGNYADNKRFIYNGTTFTADGQSNKIYFTSGRQLDFYIYYPYNQTVVDATGMDYSVSNDQREDFTQNDLMWAKASHNGGYSPVPLTFKRCNALLEGIFPTASQQIVSARMLEVITGGRLDLATGQYKEFYAKANVMMHFSGNGDNTASFRAILPPQRLKANNPLFSLNGSYEEKIVRIDRDEQLLPSTLNTLNFAPRKYNVSVWCNPDFAGIVEGGGQYSYGEHVLLTAYNNWHDYILHGWYDQGGNLISKDYQVSIVVTGDMVIEARFRNQFQLAQFRTEGQGLFKFSDSNSIVYDGYLDMHLREGESYNFEPIPSDGQKFTGWFDGNGELITTDFRYHFVMGDHPVTVIVRFEPL